MRRPSQFMWGPVLAAVTFAVSFVFSVGAPYGRMDVATSIGVSAIAAGAVWLSTGFPVWALVVVAVLTGALPLAGATFPVMDLVVVVVAFQVLMRAELPPWSVTIVCFVLLTVVDFWQRVQGGRSFMEPGVLYPAVLTALVVGLGLQSRRVRRQHAELIALRDADQRRAVSEERRRIARDLHDLAAHHLSAIIVRSKLAHRMATPEAMAAAVEFTGRTAAQALDGMRGVVRLLAADDAAPLAPAPKLSDLSDVVNTMREAGLLIEQNVAADENIPSGIALAAVRIVGEALANTLHHRGPGMAWLYVASDAGGLRVVVDDDGPGTWQPEAADAGWYRPGHLGVVNMRERALACGGHLAISRSPRGGWRVAADLPVP